MAPVSGAVTTGGKPVGGLIVTFQPLPPEGGTSAAAKRAIGETDSDGSFTLSTSTKGDGAVVGKHRVMVLSSDRSAAPPGELPPNYEVQVQAGRNHFELDLKPRK
jgi:hypothetical protein